MAMTVVSPPVRFGAPTRFVAAPVVFADTPMARFIAPLVLFVGDLPEGHWVTWEGRHLFIPNGAKGENKPKVVVTGPSGDRHEKRPHPATPAGKRGPDAAAAAPPVRTIAADDIRPGDHVTFEHAGERGAGEVTAIDGDRVAVTITQGSVKQPFHHTVYPAGERTELRRAQITEARRAGRPDVPAERPPFAPKIAAAQIKEATTRYTRHGDAQINGYLRGGNDPTHPAEDDQGLATDVQAVDQYIAKSKPLTAETTVFRGIHESAMTALGLDRNPEEAVGTTFGDRAFVSASADAQEARAFAGAALLRITLPAGTRVGNLSSISKFPAEEERLLPRGSVFRITGVAMERDKPLISCTLEPQRALPTKPARAEKAKATMSADDQQDRRSRYVWQADDLVIVGKGGE